MPAPHRASWPPALGWFSSEKPAGRWEELEAGAEPGEAWEALEDSTDSTVEAAELGPGAMLDVPAELGGLMLAGAPPALPPAPAATPRPGPLSGPSALVTPSLVPACRLGGSRMELRGELWLRELASVRTGVLEGTTRRGMEPAASKQQAVSQVSKVYRAAASMGCTCWPVLKGTTNLATAAYTTGRKHAVGAASNGTKPCTQPRTTHPAWRQCSAAQPPPTPPGRTR